MNQIYKKEFKLVQVWDRIGTSRSFGDMGMEKNNQKQIQPGLVLQYDKRRYDGGPEVEQIRLIEQQQELLRQQQYAATLGGYATPPTVASAANALRPPVAPTEAPLQAVEPAICNEEVRTRRVQDILLTGPLSICVGFVGIFTSALALLVAARMKNPALQAQGRTVMSECTRSVRKGFIDTATIPWQLLKNRSLCKKEG